MADNKKGVNPAAAAAIGAVVGAAAGAAAIALSDKDNRKKIAKKLDEYKKELGPDKFKALKEQGLKALDEFKKQVDSLRSKAADAVEEEKDSAKKKLSKKKS
jgi:hypothetical protein